MGGADGLAELESEYVRLQTRKAELIESISSLKSRILQAGNATGFDPRFVRQSPHDRTPKDAFLGHLLGPPASRTPAINPHLDITPAAALVATTTALGSLGKGLMASTETGGWSRLLDRWLPSVPSNQAVVRRTPSSVMKVRQQRLKPQGPSSQFNRPVTGIVDGGQALALAAREEEDSSSAPSEVESAECMATQNLVATEIPAPSVSQSETHTHNTGSMPSTASQAASEPPLTLFDHAIAFSSADAVAAATKGDAAAILAERNPQTVMTWGTASAAGTGEKFQPGVVEKNASVLIADGSLQNVMAELNVTDTAEAPALAKSQLTVTVTEGTIQTAMTEESAIPMDTGENVKNETAVSEETVRAVVIKANATDTVAENIQNTFSAGGATGNVTELNLQTVVTQENATSSVAEDLQNSLSAEDAIGTVTELEVQNVVTEALATDTFTKFTEENFQTATTQENAFIMVGEEIGQNATIGENAAGTATEEHVQVVMTKENATVIVTESNAAIVTQQSTITAVTANHSAALTNEENANIVATKRNADIIAIGESNQNDQAKSAKIQEKTNQAKIALDSIKTPPDISSCSLREEIETAAEHSSQSSIGSLTRHPGPLRTRSGAGTSFGRLIIISYSTVGANKMLVTWELNRSAIRRECEREQKIFPLVKENGKCYKAWELGQKISIREPNGRETSKTPSGRSQSTLLSRMEKEKEYLFVVSLQSKQTIVRASWVFQWDGRQAVELNYKSSLDSEPPALIDGGDVASDPVDANQPDDPNQPDPIDPNQPTTRCDMITELNPPQHRDSFPGIPHHHTVAPPRTTDAVPISREPNTREVAGRVISQSAGEHLDDTLRDSSYCVARITSLEACPPRRPFNASNPLRRIARDDRAMALKETTSRPFGVRLRPALSPLKPHAGMNIPGLRLRESTLEFAPSQSQASSAIPQINHEVVQPLPSPTAVESPPTLQTPLRWKPSQPSESPNIIVPSPLASHGDKLVLPEGMNTCPAVSVANLILKNEVPHRVVIKPTKPPSRLTTDSSASAANCTPIQSAQHAEPSPKFTDTRERQVNEERAPRKRDLPSQPRHKRTPLDMSIRLQRADEFERKLKAAKEPVKLPVFPINKSLSPQSVLSSKGTRESNSAESKRRFNKRLEGLKRLTGNGDYALLISVNDDLLVPMEFWKADSQNVRTQV
eukprot:Gregarina_sp_Poly_1__2204@NODE_1588_length_3774_cov_129_588616_g372_i2_p1_GENE_NODE_1588_length_3774_cov_129_588616_g372_i2NODE_1588_length_3774_cov_129_588616_g372_i2_p1_ORF_typecomplete_len1197_score209_32_NODE_1588_length_3774_cov_129_588616_g372_i2343591